jgi:hypothetical protein
LYHPSEPSVRHRDLWSARVDVGTSVTERAEKEVQGGQRVRQRLVDAGVMHWKFHRRSTTPRRSVTRPRAANRFDHVRATDLHSADCDQRNQVVSGLEVAPAPRLKKPVPEGMVHRNPGTVTQLF